MLTLQAETLDGKDFIVCLSPPVPRHYRHYVYLVIDGGAPIYSGHIDLNSGSAPTANYFFPAAAAPARARDAQDYDGVFWTRWFDTDDNEDGIEDESFVNHWLHDRSAFHNCHTPIGIQVYDYSTLNDFENSENQNADGKAQFEYSDPARGFKCRNELQTITVSTGKKPECPNTKVRYKCNTGIVQMVGRIYSDVHGRSDNADFHVNRIQQSPMLRDETPGEEWKSKADIHLNDGIDCPAGHANCGHNQRLHLEKVSGNDGLMTFLPKTPIPGAYNFTFDTLYQGAVVVNRRFQNFMNNENLYPSNFEIYPRIQEIHPNVGSVRGDTLVTITGSGFLENGLGGTVSVSIGDDVECSIEQMTESEIICRTPAQAETPPSPFEVKMAQFVDLPGIKLPETTKGTPDIWFRHELTAVPTWQECKELCATDFACLGFKFKPIIEGVDGWNGCDLTSFTGGSVEAEAEWLTRAEEQEEGTYSAYIPHASRVPQKEMDCYTGRGELYQGDIRTTVDGDECEAPCRNDNPETQTHPKCMSTRTGTMKVCKIAGCGCPKYAGNRGVQVEMTHNSTPEADQMYKVSPGRFPDKKQKFIHPVFSVNGGKKGMFFGMSDPKEYYMMRVTNYFIAPYDGFFSFSANVDDQVEVRILSKNSMNGQYDNDIMIHGAMSFGGYTERSSESGSAVYELKKGEKLYMESHATEFPGADFLSVGVIYHGKSLEESVWQSNRAKVHFPQDNYVYDMQRLYFDATDRTERVWITMKTNLDALDEDTLAKKGETWDKSQGHQFRLKQCGDSNRCYETVDIDTTNSDTWSSSKIAKHIKEEWLTTKCSHSGYFSPLNHHATYESDYTTWPGPYHFKDGQHGYCGRKAHKVTNHDIWNTQVGSKFATTQYEDLCFAYHGTIDKS